MAVPTYEEARRVIGPEREQKLVQAVAMAWKDWEGCPSRGRYSRWPRTRANMVFERLADRLIELFASDGGVRFVFADETIKVVFDELIVLRLKKSNSDGLAGNIMTQAVMNFVDAQQDIPGLNGLWKLEGVYALNPLQTAIADVFLQARDGDMKLYRYSIRGEADTQTVIPFPLRPSGPSSGYDADDLVRPRQLGDSNKKNRPPTE